MTCPGRGRGGRTRARRPSSWAVIRSRGCAGTATGGRSCSFWSLELDSELTLADRRDTFFVVQTFTVKVSIWAWLDRLDEPELTEILTDSWLARRSVRG